MTTRIFSSDKARAQWRDVLDAATAGENVIIERYGKPAVAIISFQDFADIEELLEELRDAREAQAALEEWRGDPSTGQSWEEIKAELFNGELDE